MRFSSVPLDASQVLAALAERAPGFDVRVIEECGSTNTELVETPPDALGRMQVLACERQTGGRGRRGRSWVSWGGESLTFSCRWTFEPGPHVPAGLSLVAGLAVARTLEGLGADGVQLKWPNDVLVHGRKLSGILIELVQGRGRASSAVIGIGMNLRVPDDAVIEAAGGVTDLASLLSDPPDRNALLAALLGELSALLETYASAGFVALRGAWLQRNAFAQLPVQLSGEGWSQVGICTGVDDDGALLLETPEGLRRVLSGEISLRLAS